MEKLQKTLEYMAVMADALAEGLCFIDRNGVVKIWNLSAEKIHRLEASKIIGRPLTDIFPNALMAEVHESKIPQKNISHMPRPNSHIMVSATPVYIDGEYAGVVSTEREYAEVVKLSEELKEAKEKLSFLENEVKKVSGSFSSIIGQCPKLLKKIEIAKQISHVASNVMITGESGTGKELFARGIHELSGRKGLFIPINCSAVPSELFESEFFGYMPGAFTGASTKGKAGFFELADGGTLFLDEIGDMPYQDQAKLLRALQDGMVMRVGGGQSIKVNVRILSATHKNLNVMMKAKEFRHDLFYRLNVLEIKVPPLRDRNLDIPLLVNHFIKKYAEDNSKNVSGISAKALKALCAYPWPGNVRELMNIVEYLVVTSQGSTIRSAGLPENIYNQQNGQNSSNSFENYPMKLSLAIKKLESEKIIEAIEACKGNKSKAAKLLDIPRATLYNRLKEYGLDL